jgi:hypothetical protein
MEARPSTIISSHWSTVASSQPPGSSPRSASAASKAAAAASYWVLLNSSRPSRVYRWARWSASTDAPNWSAARNAAAAASSLPMRHSTLASLACSRTASAAMASSFRAITRAALNEEIAS